eukprot:6743424-Prymnesium_polylepis.1
MILALSNADELASDLYVNNMVTILVNQQYFDIDGLALISSKPMIAMLYDDEYDVVLPSVDESRD